MNHGQLVPGSNSNLNARALTYVRLMHQQNMLRLGLLHQRQRREDQEQPSNVNEPSEGRYQLRNTRARAKRVIAEQIAANTDDFRAPELPFEVIINILRLSLVREPGKTVFLRPSKSVHSAHIEQETIDTPIAKRRFAYNINSEEQPPLTEHNAPATNLLLVSKAWRNEAYNLFYGSNVLSFEDDDHFDDVLRRLDRQKIARIHHISFESQWELKVHLKPDLSGEVQHEFGLDWGHVMTQALWKLPNIQTITLRIRCTARHKEFIEIFRGFEWQMRSGTETIRRDKQMLDYPEIRDGMEAWIAKKIEAEYEELNVARYLPKIKLAFLYSETKEWAGNERTVALCGVERDPDRFGINR